jgi:hypothetical protein
MRRGTVILFVFVLVAAVVVGASLFLQRQPPAQFTLVVNPLAADWARAAVARFNDSAPLVNATQRVQFSVTTLDDLAVWQDTPGWTAADRPAAWLPALSAAVDYSARFTVLIPSLARTPLVWGAYQSRADVATGDGAQPLDWDAVQAAAAAESWAALDGGSRDWRFVKLAFPRPDQSMTGLAALFTAAADYANAASVTGSALRDSTFRAWLEPVIASVPNFQTLGADPAAAMARGPSTVEIALLPESLWLNNLRGLTGSEPVVFAYPQFQLMLDFPLAGWASAADVSDTERAAVLALGEWLAAPQQQAALLDHGLRPAQAEPDASAALFAAAAPYGILYEPDYGQAVLTPSRTDALSLIQWFSSSQRR